MSDPNNNNEDEDFKADYLLAESGQNLAFEGYSKPEFTVDTDMLTEMAEAYKMSEDDFKSLRNWIWLRENTARAEGIAKTLDLIAHDSNPKVAVHALGFAVGASFLQGRTQEEIAKKLKCCSGTLSYRAREFAQRFNIQSRYMRDSDKIDSFRKGAVKGHKARKSEVEPIPEQEQQQEEPLPHPDEINQEEELEQNEES